MSASGQLLRACGACGDRPAYNEKASLCDACAETICRQCKEPRCIPEDGGLCRDCDAANYDAACDAAYDAWREDGLIGSLPRAPRRGYR